MNKILKNNLRHFKRLKRHPLMQNHVLEGMSRYVMLNSRFYLKAELTVKWINNLKYYLRKGDAGLIGNYYYDLYEVEESLFLYHLLRKEDLFFDIGANLGHYSLFLSGTKRNKSIALEPVPSLYEQLKRNVFLNELQDTVCVKQIGLSEKKDKLTFSNNKGTMNRVVNENYKNSIIVPVETLDNLINEQIPVAIKIDVEGFEYFVLQGAEQTLKCDEVKAVIIEFNNSGEKYGISDIETFNFLINYGFKPFDYDFKNRKMIGLSSHNKKRFNTIMIRDLDFVQRRIESSVAIQIGKNYF